MTIETIGTLRALVHDGATIATEQDGLDVIGSCYGEDIDIVVLPTERLAEDFFRLRTGLAGAVLQKFQNYGLRVAIVGDIARFTETSAPLRDFVRESNRGRHVLFVPDREALLAAL